MAKPKHNEYSLWVEMDDGWKEVLIIKRVPRFYLPPTLLLGRIAHEHLEPLYVYKILPTGNKP